MKKTNSTRFILIHGSWHGSWCWSYLTPLLESAGYTVHSPDLPGHGEDLTPFTEITFNSYVNSVDKLLHKVGEPVILVGHSFGGAVATAVAANSYDLIERLVYISGFFPLSGQSTTEIAQSRIGSALAGKITISPDKLNQEIPLSVVQEAFYGHCSGEIANWAISQLRSDPYFPNIEPIIYNELALARVKKHYIECVDDRAIVLDLQRQMQKGTKWESVETLVCDHSPMMSHPLELAEILLRIADR